MRKKPDRTGGESDVHEMETSDGERDSSLSH